MTLHEIFSCVVAIFLAFFVMMMYIIIKDWHRYAEKRIRQELEQQGAKIITIRRLIYDDTISGLQEHLLGPERYSTIYYVDYLDADGKFHAKNAIILDASSPIVWKDHPKEKTR